MRNHVITSMLAFATLTAFGLQKLWAILSALDFNEFFYEVAIPDAEVIGNLLPLRLHTEAWTPCLSVETP